MPTIQINVKATKQNDDLIFLELEYDERKVEMTVISNMTMLEMAQLAINQPFPELPDVKYDGIAEITFHNETVIDEDGIEHIVRVVDEVNKI